MEDRVRVISIIINVFLIIIIVTMGLVWFFNMDEDDKDGSNSDPNIDNTKYGTIEDLAVEFEVDEYWQNYYVDITISNPTNKTIEAGILKPKIIYSASLTAPNGTEIIENVRLIHPEGGMGNSSTRSLHNTWYPGAMEKMRFIWEPNGLGDFISVPTYRAGPDKFPEGIYEINFKISKNLEDVHWNTSFSSTWIFEQYLSVNTNGSDVIFYYEALNNRNYTVTVMSPYGNLLQDFYLYDGEGNIVNQKNIYTYTQAINFIDIEPHGKIDSSWKISKNDLEIGYYIISVTDMGIGRNIELSFHSGIIFTGRDHQ